MVTVHATSNIFSRESAYSLRISVGDLRKAILGGGDISSFASVCHQALGSPPFTITQKFDEPLTLLGHRVFIDATYPKPNADLVFQEGGTVIVDPAALARVDLKLVPLVPYGKNVSRFLERVIEETNPDLIAIDLCPVEMSAQILFTFSLLSALGLPLHAVIRNQDTREEYLNQPFYPGSMAETAIIKSWLNKIPLISIGRPLKPRRLEFLPEQGVIDLDYLENPQWETNLLIACRAIDAALKDYPGLEDAIQYTREISLDLIKTLSDSVRESVIDQSGYTGSRLLDIASGLETNGRQARILVLADVAHYTDLEYVVSLLRQGITEEIYTPPEPEGSLGKMVLEGRIVDNIKAEAQDLIPESTLPQELFYSELERWAEVKEAEILPEAESYRLIVEIANRTRIHPEITRGVSVRGAIAFEEIARGLSEMHGGLTRGCLGKAAQITLPPRITLKQKGDAAAIVHDITLEVLYGFRFSGTVESALSTTLKRLRAGDVLANLNPLTQTPAEEQPASSHNQSPAVISKTDENQETLKRLEDLRFLKKDEQGQYQLTRKALEYMLKELEQQLKAGEITPDEYGRQKSGLMKALHQISKPQYQISSRELANTILEMMDAQDKLWEKEVNFSTLHVYYHIKENSEGSSLISPKRDYQALKKLIDDLDKRKILTAAEKSSGFVLTGLALQMLLKYLLEKDTIGQGLQGVIRLGKALTRERKSEVRRYSSGDTFRDISVRHTLKEITRQKKSLSEVRSSDFRVFLKQSRDPQCDIIICLDTSGSMGFHQKMTYARLAAAGLAQAALAEGNRVGLVAFNDYGQVTVPLTEQDQDGILNCIAATTPRGNTNIGDGIKSSMELLSQSQSSHQKFIMLVTDGQPTAISESDFARLKPTKERDLTEESALLETRQAAAKGVRLSVIHVAAEAETSSEFIKDIVRVGKGKVRRISSAEDLRLVMR